MSTCCGTLYYCTASGPVAVPPDGNGRYAPPPGWTGAPPVLTAGEASAACPLPPLTLVGSGCCGGAGLAVPGRVYFNLVNKTGTLAAGLPNSVAVDLSDDSTGTAAIANGTAMFSAGRPVPWTANVHVVCPSEVYAPGSTPPAEVVVSVNPPNLDCPAGSGSVTGTSPWTHSPPGGTSLAPWQVYRTLACGGWPL